MYKTQVLLCCVLLVGYVWADSFSIDMKTPPTNFPHFWEECVGSGHALLALRKDYQAHLTQAHDELGFKRVRFHGLFDDDMSVVITDDKGQMAYSFFNIDQVFDFLMSIGMKPYVEISFMPELLASGTSTIMHYKGNTSPPKSYDQWNALVAAFAQHIIDRYSIQEVSTWTFEVWNEPNCGFFNGTQADYFTLYKNTALTLKSVNSQLKVGGPVTCQSAWIPEFLDFAKQNNVPVDFVATHEYPTDITPFNRETLENVFTTSRQQAGSYPLFYSEFNDGLFYSPSYHDTSYASAFLFYTLYQVQGLVDILSWWTFTDIFEEQGQTSQPYFTNNGWGLLNIYQVPKPSYRAFQLLHGLGTNSIKVTTTSAQPQSALGAWAVVSADGNSLDVLIYNFDVPSANITDGTVSVQITNLEQATPVATITRIDDTNANAPKAWVAMGSPLYPTQAQIAQLLKASELQTQKLPLTVVNSLTVSFSIPVPAYGVAVVNIPL